jgi:hypothetical protein
MRLEIIIPESARPAVKSKLTHLLDQLKARPEPAVELQSSSDAGDPAIQITPAPLDEIDAASPEVRERHAAIREARP